MELKCIVKEKENQDKNSPSQALRIEELWRNRENRTERVGTRIIGGTLGFGE